MLEQMTSGHIATAVSPRFHPRRQVARVLVGVVLVVGSAGAIVAGGLMAFVSVGKTYVELGAHGSYRTDRLGLATDSTNWRTQFLGWADAVRLEVASDDEKPIFVGVAAPNTISRWLSATGYTTYAEHIGQGVTRIDHGGAASVAPSVKAVDWTAQAQGVGTQTLSWKATDGPQVVFAMNADGSRPVAVRIASSAVTLGRMPVWVPAGTLVFGIVLLSSGIVVLRRAMRARRAAAH